jgi:dTDP-4-amino-4,6-dideoxygalactose transaminase
MSNLHIPFNFPHLTGEEILNIEKAHKLGRLAGDGFFTKECHQWMRGQFNLRGALLTHSCTAALEMMAILADLAPGDEVIMPSYTFVSTANAFVLRGAVPVFVDVRPDTLNIDEKLIDSAINTKTKAIVPVHYAGVACEMDEINQIAKNYNLLVLEDAAQGVMSRYKGRSLGALGHLGAYSFHETKNIICGEGGALTINDDRFLERAEIIREKGTNRSKFFRGDVDKYSWVDMGSSYLPGEISAAFLSAQFEQAQQITDQRLMLWGKYHEAFQKLEDSGYIVRPTVPEGCEHNAHMYYVLVNDLGVRTALIEHLREQGIMAVFHYVPLHTSEAGKRFSKVSGKLSVTENIADRLIRLPLYCDLSQEQIEKIIASV